MKTILVEDDLYSYLVSHTQEIGESATSILRRLLGLQSTAAASKTRGDLVKVFDFLDRWDQFRHVNKARKFLQILSWAYQKHPNDFDRVLAIEGNRRKYFARDQRTLLESGSSTNPRPIPNSPFWVITNNSTAKKAEILSEVMRLLGYAPDDTQALIHEFAS
jgi:negative modulator of initiation of replication